MMCSERGCRRTARWVWAEYDSEMAMCEAHMLEAVELFVKSRSVGELEILGPENGRLGRIGAS